MKIKFEKEIQTVFKYEYEFFDTFFNFETSTKGISDQTKPIHQKNLKRIFQNYLTKKTVQLDIFPDENYKDILLRKNSHQPGFLNTLMSVPLTPTTQMLYNQYIKDNNIKNFIEFIIKHEKKIMKERDASK